MNTVLSVPGTAVSEEVQPSLLTRVFSKTKALKVAKAVLPVRVHGTVSNSLERTRAIVLQ